MIIMNMENKVHTIFSPPNNRFTASPQAAITEPQKSQISLNPQKKLELPDNRGKEKSRQPPAPSANPHS